MSTETVHLLLPELVLVLAATAIFVAGAFFPHARGWNGWAALSLVVAAALLLLQFQTPGIGVTTDAATGGVLSGPLAIDLLAQLTRAVVLIAGLLLVLMTARAAPAGLAAEFAGVLLLIFAGLMLVSMAVDLVLLFVALELISIPTYVLLYLGRKDAASQESAAKYFFLSILSSALLLYGFSFLYGACGTTELLKIHDSLRGQTESAPILLLARLALVLIVAGLGFRITAVPFHFYAPDVYQGTTHQNAGLLAVLPKIAGVIALVRIAATAMPGLEELGWQLSLALAFLTMTFGNVVALWQNNLRRLMAYSSIAHGGYLLIGLAVGFATEGGAPGIAGFDGVGATLFYLVVYSLATLGVFAALSHLSSPQRPVETVDDLAGLWRTRPATAAAIAVFMFSLTGLPPLAGFFGKFMLISGALGVDPEGLEIGGPFARWFVALALAAVVNAAISAAYYLRIVAAMYFRSPVGAPPARGGLATAAATLLCTVGVIGVGLYPDPLIGLANHASRSARLTLVRPRTLSDAATARVQAAPAPRR